MNTSIVTHQPTATTLQFRPRTYAEALPDMLAEQAEMERAADPALAWFNAAYQPQPRELFVVYCLTTWGGWRTIYGDMAQITRFFAVRIQRAANDPNVKQLVILRGRNADAIDDERRRWRQANGYPSLNIY